MSDPAVEAAQRAWAAAEQPFIPTMSLEQAGVAAAREALAPLRDLEVPENLRVVAEMLAQLKMDTPKDQKITDDFVAMLRNMADNTARLIYPAAELEPSQPI
jgi:hypothetical protein